MPTNNRKTITKRPVRRALGVIGISALLIMLAATAIMVFAVHDLGLFELDRNATDEAGGGDDWATLYAGGGSAQEFTGILADIGADGGTQFQAGGSKDDLDISPAGVTGQHWKWEPGEPLDKDDITNAYAAAYINTVDTGDNNIGDLIVYFGLDRYANNGSAQVGFWFLQDPEFGLTDIKDGGGLQFSGVHTVNDILVQSNFTQGGLIDSISVYKWVGSGGSDGTLDLLFSAQDCSITLADDPACATVNQGDTPSPWPFTPKFGTSGTFPQGSFFEGGINLTRLVPDAGCFTGFLAETRSSTPFDSRLKDFVTGSFDLCSIDVSKTGDGLSKVGDPADYTVTITNTGSIMLYKDVITDTLLGPITEDGVDLVNDYVNYNDCGDDLAVGASCTITLTRTVLNTDPDPLPNTVNVIYRGKEDLSGTAVTGSDDHSVNLFQPAIAAAKTGDELSKVGDVIDYTITLTNTSSADTPALNCTAYDPLLGTLFDDVLPLGETVINASYTVVNTDPDPLVNTVTLTCVPEGFPNILTATANHSTNLFQPAIAADKTGDALSKVGDDINYTITLTNTSSTDTPALNCTAYDPLLGTLFDDVLPLGETVINASHTVVNTDPDPLVNTVTLVCLPDGFPNVLTKEASHSTNLFQPSVEVDKSGDELSKVGDDVTYTFKITNTSSWDTPDLIFYDPEGVETAVYDTLLGDLTDEADAAGCDGLAPETSDGAGDEESCTFQVVRTVVNTDPDPLDNLVTVHYNPGPNFDNDITDSDDHSVNLFQPGVDVDKTGDTLSKVGDDVDYTITVTNNSSPDSPNLVNGTIVDTLLGDLLDGSNPYVTSSTCSATLTTGSSCVIHATRTVLDTDLDPLDNTVTVHYNPVDFPNDITDSDDHSVNLFQPGVDVDKTGDTLSKVGDNVTYTFIITNISSWDTPDLVFYDPEGVETAIYDTLLGDLTTAADAAGCDGLAPESSDGAGDEESCTFQIVRTVLETDPDTLDNTVTVHYNPVGFPNDITDSDDHSVNLFQPAIAVDKTGDPLSKVGDEVDYTITLSNNSSTDTPALTCVATDSLMGELYNGVLPLGDTVLTPSRTVLGTDPDPLVNSVSMTCNVAGFPNVVGPVIDDHTTELFQPNVEVIKDGPTEAFVGETITYDFTINNLSSDDAPDLILASVTDTVLGDLTGTASANGCGTLTYGGSCSFTYDYTILGSDPNPLENEVTVLYHPEDFPNDITDDDDHSLEVKYLYLGCTPGFWQGGAGLPLWNDPPNDPQWPNPGTQPFYTEDLFNDIFTSIVDPRLNGLTMLDLVGSGGTSDSARRAARDMVAAYLNESAFPDDYPATSPGDLLTKWYDAVAGGDSDLDDFHTKVSDWNNPDPPGYCPLP